MNSQGVTGLVLQTIHRSDQGIFSKDLGDDMAQWVEDVTINSRLLPRNLLKSEIGTISDETRLNSTPFNIHDPIDQWLELFTLLRSHTDDVSCLDTNHPTFGPVGDGHEVIENGVDLVPLTNPNVGEIGEQDRLRG